MVKNTSPSPLHQRDKDTLQPVAVEQRLRQVLQRFPDRPGNESGDQQDQAALGRQRLVRPQPEGETGPDPTRQSRNGAPAASSRREPADPPGRSMTPAPASSPAIPASLTGRVMTSPVASMKITPATSIQTIPQMAPIPMAINSLPGRWRILIHLSERT